MNPQPNSGRELGNVEAFSVCRQDDNGAVTTIRCFDDESEAEALLAELEARGHKQFYWIESYSVPAAEASPSSPAVPS